MPSGNKLLPEPLLTYIYVCSVSVDNELNLKISGICNIGYPSKSRLKYNCRKAHTFKLPNLIDILQRARQYSNFKTTVQYDNI